MDLQDHLSTPEVQVRLGMRVRKEVAVLMVLVTLAEIACRV